MTIDQKQYAVTAWAYAVSICIRNTEGAEKDAVICVEERPTVENIRAVLAIARCKPWAPLIESALIEIGIAGFEQIMREH